MHRILLILALCLTACGSFATEGEPGPQGPAGPPGEDGAEGPRGPAGADAIWSGARLTSLCIHGDDGSGVCDGLFMDGERDEECRFREYKGEWLCMPKPEDATEWFVWVAPDCTGDRGYVSEFKGSHTVRMLSNDPSFHGTVLARAEEVPVLHYKGPANNEACQVAQGAGFPPPYYRWAEASADIFVSGEVMP